YYLLPATSCHYGDRRMREFWRELLGQNAVELDDLDAVCETIALTIGLGEQAIDLDEGLRDLARTGSAATDTVSKALAPLAGGRRVEVSALPVTDGQSGAHGLPAAGAHALPAARTDAGASGVTRL